MIKIITLFTLIIGSTIWVQAQEKPILVYDLVNGTLDTIPIITYDSTITSNQTPYFTGNFNTNIEMLAQTTPVTNVFLGADFTLKKRAAIDYQLSSFPIRTSVKVCSVNDGITENLCSGSMISRKHVLSAAHCIADINTNILSQDSIQICPIFDNGSANADFTCNEVVKIYFFRDWNLGGEDFAIFELDQDLGESTGWLSIGFESDHTTLLNTILYKFSYPAVTFMQADTNEYNGDTLYYNYGLSDTIDDYSIRISNATGIPGESGSSITKVINNETYTTYGVLSFSNHLFHSKINNWRYYAIENIIHDYLTLNTKKPTISNQLIVYPNPLQDQLFIDHLPLNALLSVYDYSGQLILKQNTIGSNTVLNLAELSSGLYLIKIKAIDVIITKKIIKL